MRRVSDVTFRLPASAKATAGHRSFTRRWQAEVLLLALLLAGCAATTNRTHDDLSTTTQVKIALLSDTQLGSLRLDVKTFQGVVTLTGTVRSAADQQHAIALAKRIHGVRDVRSQLKVEVPGFQRPGAAGQ
jgi:hypothetical protein